MTTLFTLLESGVELRSELPSAEDCDDMIARWELSYPDGGVLILDAYDDQGHTMRVAVRSSDVRMMRYIPDDDPLLIRERAMEALRAEYDGDHPVVDAEIADDSPEDDDGCDGELSLEGNGGEVRL